MAGRFTWSTAVGWPWVERWGSAYMPRPCPICSTTFQPRIAHDGPMACLRISALFAGDLNETARGWDETEAKFGIVDDDGWVEGQHT